MITEDAFLNYIDKQGLTIEYLYTLCPYYTPQEPWYRLCRTVEVMRYKSVITDRGVYYILFGNSKS